MAEELRACQWCKDELPESAYAPFEWRTGRRSCRGCLNAMRRHRRSGGPPPPRPTRWCAAEDCDRDISDYQMSARFCSMECSHREWYKQNADAVAEYQADYKRLRQYGLTKAQFLALLAEQGGYCAICGKPPSRPVVDHDHACCDGQRTCGKCVRAILCHRCNVMIGMAGDDPGVLTGGAAYLRDWQARGEGDVGLTA